MVFRPFRDVLADSDGRGMLKLTLSLCLLAMAGAASSPTFQANPLIGGTITQFRNHLPETLQKVTDALNGR